jgi:hypothetical protein
VLDETANVTWSIIRDFGNYTLWVDGVDESGIEEGRPGDAVGAVRNIRIGDTRFRQRLLAHSDRDRSYTYEFCEPCPFLVRDYSATIEWRANFDCAGDEQGHWTGFFARGFATWLGSLRRHLTGESLRRHLGRMGKQ